ncbi:hypothetical protein [Sediminibacterium sp.]|uniref:GNAT family N-acetyltransferase n=1 Tax=Sediminibacterium sp. TaxID=1917865 RepID=UPI0025F36FB5|nr:hypothetical protein [Sediminibacterium sp.]MBT9485463.1 hypothetical protein [Sediminibacterium sp.]
MPIIREAVLEDARKVAALQYKFGISPDTEDDWKRLWVDNPAKHSDIPIGWVLEEKGEVVGFLGNVSRRYELGGVKIKAVAARGWVVEPAFRNVTVLLLSKYLNQRNVDLQLNSSSNNKAYHVFEKMGSRTVPLDVYSRLLFWVTHRRNFMTSIVCYFQLPMAIGKLVAEFGGLLSVLPVTFMDYYMNKKMVLMTNRFELKIIQPNLIGTDFDLLWESKRKERTCLLGDRSSVMLKWHFSKEEFKTRIICCYEQGNLQGYLAVAKMKNGKTDFLRHVIIDLIVLNNSKPVIEFLIAAAYQFSRSEKVVALELLGFTEEVREVVKDMKAFGRKSFPTPFTYKLVNKKLPVDLFAEKSTWYPSLFDGDSSL